ncbi:MAG: exodeoxyribonuclease VII large subunit, partial [Methanomicrobium sp.]|nr:exodeoxyribonuclease VII large subunit [Methanomicrobium sp.]
LFFKKLLVDRLENIVETENRNLENLKLHLLPRRLEKIINGQYEKLDDLFIRLSRGINQCLEREKMNLMAVKSELELLNPAMPLEKGFCMIKSGDNIIKNVSELKAGQNVILHMNDGSANANIKEIFYGRKL